MARAPFNWRIKRLLDLVHFREGTFLELIEVEPKRQGIKRSYKVKFCPDVDMITAPIQYLKLWGGIGNVVKVTDDQFPERGIRKTKLENRKPGTPEDVVMLLENEQGHAPVRDLVLDMMEDSIADAEDEIGQAEADAIIQKAKNVGMGGSDRVTPSEETPTRPSSTRRGSGSRRSGGSDDDSGKDGKKSGRGKGRRSR